MTRLLLLLCLLPLACTKGHTTGPAKNLLRLPLFAEPQTLDTAAAQDEASLQILFALQQGLTKRDTYGRVLPALAERWEIAKDGKHLTFFLRNTKWSDGVDVRAQDFVFAWQRVLDPKNNNPLAAKLFAIENAESFHAGTVLDFSSVGVRATEPMRLDISLAHPDAMLLETLSTALAAPQRQDVVTANPTDFASPAHLKVTGPYLLRDWQKGAKVVLVVNPKFYGTRPQIPTVELEVFKDPVAALQRYEKGDLDILLPVPNTDRERVKQMADYQPYALHRTPPGAIVAQPQYEKIGVLVKPYVEDFTVDSLGHPIFAAARFKQDNPAEN